MNGIIETVKNSLKEIIGNTVQILPAVMIALVIIMLTRYAAEFARGIAEKLGKKVLHKVTLYNYYCLKLPM